MDAGRVRVKLLALLVGSVFALIVSRVSAQDAALPDLARGRHVATAIAGCADCHGAQFAGGRAFALPGGSVYSANLTGGAGGIAAFKDADIRRAIRSGIGPDGTPLRIMPAREYAIMTDADVDDVVAFLRSLPPVDAVVPRAMSGVHSLPAVDGPAATIGPVAAGDGSYFVSLGGCTSCHGAHLGGARRPAGPAAPNISHDALGSWTFADFQTAMRSGITPGGRVLSTAMPWQRVGRLSDAELRSLYDYLESQSATASRS